MPYSLYTAATLSLLLIGLSLNISRQRLRHRVSFGDGGNPALTAAIRAHGNSLEQSLLFLILLYLLESATATGAPWLTGLALTFVGARVLYCAALFGRKRLLRQVSHGVTMLVLLLTTLMLLVPST
ncbi:MAG TPA: MAPEG family protein [Pseudomonas sp.]|nr:MAPEG family protein [Pseudomonas sp.]